MTMTAALLMCDLNQLESCLDSPEDHAAFQNVKNFVLAAAQKQMSECSHTHTLFTRNDNGAVVGICRACGKDSARN